MKPVDPRLLKQSKPARWHLLATGGLSLVAAAVIVGQAVLLATIITRAAQHKAGLAELRPEIMWLGGLLIARAVIDGAFDALGRFGATRVMSDLRGRRGHVVGTEPGEDAGWTVVQAEVPQSELSRYPIDLRSVSHGTGSFTREPLRHDLLPADQAKDLLPE